MTTPKSGSVRTVYRSAGPPVLQVDLTDVTIAGEVQEWHTVTAQHGQPGAVVVALHNNRILVGEHWRLTTGRRELEFPRGFGEPSEGAADTASRELREETGLVAKSVAVLGTVFADTGLLTNPIHVVQAHVDRVDSERVDRDPEFEDLYWLDAREVRSRIADGSLRDAISLAAFALWQARQAD